MLNHLGRRSCLISSPSSLPTLAFSSRQLRVPLKNTPSYSTSSSCSTFEALNLNINNEVLPNIRRKSSTLCAAARRRVRYEDEDEEEEEEEYGHNQEIAMLEVYSQSFREEALVVHALVDDQEVEVLIFKGFSSCLNYRTPPDPSKSILPARAVIKSIDRVKGPFDPSNIEYLQKGLTWEAFKSNILQ
ncbi:hypothetical protein FNV43_RR26844 [Rhamnella rubrinervis]|uniref:DUF7734 domain-containing protein n=1 Tax=Rhamnella rubrinervis TaxID=2594499 RepID=A0A8K0DQM6_9ROSA|nr:hypothetical protein FNV43_RR26844 [Rhamnella rubrinervis]